MVGTSALVNWTGTDAKAIVDKTKNKSKRTHKLNIWQYNNLPSVFAAWSNNADVKSLRNCHSPIFNNDGVQLKIKIDRARQRDPELCLLYHYNRKTVPRYFV